MNIDDITKIAGSKCTEIIEDMQNITDEDLRQVYIGVVFEFVAKTAEQLFGVDIGELVNEIREVTSGGHAG